MNSRANLDLLEQGVALFNRGRFFECHETLETLWKRIDGPERDLVQGIIQVAAALLHLERGNPAGARSLYAKALRRLAMAGSAEMGLKIGELRDDLARYFEAIGDSKPSRAGTAAKSAVPLPRLHRVEPR